MTLAFELGGAALDEAIRRMGAMPLPPYIASRRAPDERDRSRLSDHVRAGGRRGRRADRRAAFHAGR